MKLEICKHPSFLLSERPIKEGTEIKMATGILERLFELRNQQPDQYRGPGAISCDAVLYTPNLAWGSRY